MSSFRRRSGWILVSLSLLLHAFTVYCFARQPDIFAAYTVMPIWLWGGIGLFLSTSAFYFFRAPLSLVITAVWASTLLVGADEARVLSHLGREAPLPGPAQPYDGLPVVRVLTVNCAAFQYGDPAPDIARWAPDIVLLQDVRPHRVRQIADILYGGHGDYRAHRYNGLVTRWKIQREVRNPDPTLQNSQFTVALPGGNEIEIVNVHLRTAATDLRLWQPSAWKTHRNNRVQRLKELALVEQILTQTTSFPNTPTIFGGDFNAPATDVVHRHLARDFTDSFATVGSGWGNTFHRQFPMLRIDYLYATRHFTPVRSSVAITRASDHRMLVTDFLAPSP